MYNKRAQLILTKDFIEQLHEGFSDSTPKAVSER